MSFYALLVTGMFLVLFGMIITNKGGTFSLFLFKIIPGLLGIWCLWEAALLYLVDKV